MKTFGSLHLLATLGVLGVATAASAQVDTSKWKCETCPFPKGITGSVDAGVGAVSDASPKYGDYTGMHRKGAYALLDGAVSRRGDDGYFADLSAADLGLDSRRISGLAGREGLYSLGVGYLQVPRHLTERATTPFLGSGGDVLTLPAGFPAGSTDTMPLATTLQPIELGYRYQRYDLGASLVGGQNWTVRVGGRRQVRDGTKSTYGSFFSSASQFAAPVQETTDDLEVAVAYTTRRLQATLGVQVSKFRNDYAGLTWTNPFVAILPGATTGQLALAPDNDFQQVTGSAGYDITPTIRVSGDVAFGRMTQDEAFLAPTLNTLLAPTVPALPASSLDGRAETFSGGLKVSAAPLPNLRLTASVDRDRRRNRTSVMTFPTVTTDLLLDPAARSTTPFSFIHDRFKIGADYRGPGSWRLSGGIDNDWRQRTYQEVVTTSETTLWGRVATQPRDNLTVSLKLTHAWRDNSSYGTSIWFGYAENPLLRKFYLADRRRTSAAGHADVVISEKISLGVSADFANDEYNDSPIGLRSARSANLAADLSVAVSERTQVHAFAQGQRVRSEQAGSQTFGGPDWIGRVKDRYEALGVGIKHAAIPNKLDIGGDLSWSRAHSDVAVDNGSGAPPFPTASTRLDSLKLYASYKLLDNVWLTGSYWYEHYDTQDWRFDGIAPATVPNLLSLGAQPPRYSVNVVRLGVRYRF
ncbi:MAG: MtrB/PioB family decaheme-associated outer membrane protein [Caldimonas sp.]